MAFSRKRLALWGTAGLKGQANQNFTYWEDTTLNNIVVSGYMDDATDLFQKDDLIWVVGSDDRQLYRVSSETDAATVTLSRVSSALVHSSIYTTVGGSATESVTVSGATASDVVSVTMHTEGATPVTIKRAEATTSSITVEFSADPSSDHQINVLVFKPVS